MFQPQTKIAPSIPRIGPTTGVNVKKIETMKVTPSKKVFLILNMNIKESVTAVIWKTEITK